MLGILPLLDKIQTGNGKEERESCATQFYHIAITVRYVFEPVIKNLQQIRIAFHENGGMDPVFNSFVLVKSEDPNSSLDSIFHVFPYSQFVILKKI